MMKTSKKGFTLAEVLTTLMVIGVVAAMTIPTLMNSTNDQQFKVAYKKAMSVLGQASQLMVAQERECTVTDNASLARCMHNVMSGTLYSSTTAGGVKVDSANGNIIVTSDGLAYAFFYNNHSKPATDGQPAVAGDNTNGTRSLTTICGTANAQFGDDYNPTSARCIVVVDLNGPSKGAKTFVDVKPGTALTTTSIAGEDQQPLLLSGEGVRPMYIGTACDTVDNEGRNGESINNGYRYMYGNTACPIVTSGS